jgi:hypothetical protein
LTSSLPVVLTLVLPSDKEISFTFLQPFFSGTPRTPDRLTHEAYVIQYTLRRYVLYRTGNAESLTPDIMISEIEGAIMDGMGMTRQQPFAHWISWLLSRLEAERYIGMLEHSKFAFLTY